MNLTYPNIIDNKTGDVFIFGKMEVMKAQHPADTDLHELKLITKDNKKMLYVICKPGRLKESLSNRFNIC